MTWQLYRGDCLDHLATIGTHTVDAVITDPPYFQVLADDWDNQWENQADFIAWLHRVAAEWCRVLKPTGSLYVFASSQMAAKIEVLALEPAGFEILNRLVWAKPQRRIMISSRARLTRYHGGDNERIIFATPFSPSVGASIDRSWENICHAVRAKIFAPIREHLQAERERAGATLAQIDQHLGKKGMAGHYFGGSQWLMPALEKYEIIRALFDDLTGGKCELKPYLELALEHRQLAAAYQKELDALEHQRRAFDLGAESSLRPRGEVWPYRPVQPSDGKYLRHPAEKPGALIEHMVLTSTRPGDLVLDSFTGSGAIGETCLRLGRNFIGAELDPQWQEMALKRLETAAAGVWQPQLPTELLNG